MKMGFVIVEFQEWETHLNRIKDFTGSQVRMSNTTLPGRSSDRDNISVDRDICGWSVWWIIFKAQSKIWGFRILIFALLCLTKNLWLLGLFKRFLHFFFSWDICFYFNWTRCVPYVIWPRLDSPDTGLCFVPMRRCIWIELDQIEDIFFLNPPW